MTNLQPGIYNYKTNSLVFTWDEIESKKCKFFEYKNFNHFVRKNLLPHGLYTVVLPKIVDKNKIKLAFFDDSKNLASIDMKSTEMLSPFFCTNCKNLTNVRLSDKTALNFSLDGIFANSNKLESLEIDKSIIYTSIDGVLYNKDVTKLIACPYGKKEIAIPETVKIIGAYSFLDTSIETLLIPENVEELDIEAFFGNKIKNVYVLSKSIIDNGSYIEDAKKIHIHKEAINNCDFFGVLNLCRSGKLEFIKDDLDSLIKMYTGKNTKLNIEDLTK